MGSFKAERAGRGKGVSRTNVGGALAMPAHAVGHGRGESGEREGEGGDDDLVPFVVLVTDDCELVSPQYLSTKLEDFVARVLLKARVLKIIAQDEEVVRLRLVTGNGARVTEYDQGLTLREVQICTRPGAKFVPVIKKTPPPQATVLSDVTGYPSTTAIPGEVMHRDFVAGTSTWSQRRQKSPSCSCASTGSNHPSLPS